MTESTVVRVVWLVLSLLLGLPGIAQTANTVFGSGYALPIPIPVAPGEVVNLLVQGVGGKLTGRVAAPSGSQLPTVLAGISVTLQQAIGALGQPQSEPAPMLVVRPISTCINSAPAGLCGSYTAITVQIPFDLVVSTGTAPPNTTRLVVSENGVSGGAVELAPRAYLIHVLNSCDVQAASGLGCGAAPAITHVDGSLVSLVNPAKSGEELVMYSFGLGATSPSVPTGQTTPIPAPVTQSQFELNFDYRPDAPPSNQIIVPSACQTTPVCPQLQPVFSGLTPGFAGLYQVNFIVPPPPTGTPACDGANVGTNMTVSLVAPTSFDGAGICVDTTRDPGKDSVPHAALFSARSPRISVPERRPTPNALIRQFIGLN